MRWPLGCDPAMLIGQQVLGCADVAADCWIDLSAGLLLSAFGDVGKCQLLT